MLLLHWLLAKLVTGAVSQGQAYRTIYYVMDSADKSAFDRDLIGRVSFPPRSGLSLESLLSCIDISPPVPSSCRSGTTVKWLAALPCIL